MVSFPTDERFSPEGRWFSRNSDCQDVVVPPPIRTRMVCFCCSSLLMDFVHSRVGPWSGSCTSTHGIHSFTTSLSLYSCLRSFLVDPLSAPTTGIRDFVFIFRVSDHPHTEKLYESRSRHRRGESDWTGLRSYEHWIRRHSHLATTRSSSFGDLHVSTIPHDVMSWSYSVISFMVIRSSFRYLRFFFHY